MESNPINADNKENIENSDNNLQYGAIDFVLKHQMWLILFAILIIAFAFRFWGAMQWGHGLVYHPDEVGFVRIVFEGIKFGNFFDHPQLYASILRGLFGSNVPTGAASLQSMYAAGRMFGIMMSLITVVAVFFIGKKVHSKKAGYIAAFLLAITPIHIWHSHYMYNDIPVLAGIALTLLFSLYIIDNANFKWYILAGLSAVFAMGMKHTGWIALLVLILAHVLHHFYKSKGHEKRLKFFLKSVFDMNIFIAIGVVLVIYFITNLSFFANFAQFYAYMTQYTSGYTAVSGNVPFNSPYIFKILATFPFSMGILLYLAVLPGFFYAFKKRSKYDILLLAFFLAYFLYVGGWAKP
ncbi:glycosyltransferase family 39 protein, partial [Candidatus Woesearchaeota archaeon]|nr:glycosyltransferase family 39 protein [Candidatus Woesearchaeota archaeon]